jgi:hypothetical protein
VLCHAVLPCAVCLLLPLLSRTAVKRGVHLTSKSRPLAPADLQRFDVSLVAGWLPAPVCTAARQFAQSLQPAGTTWQAWHATQRLPSHHDQSHSRSG